MRLTITAAGLLPNRARRQLAGTLFRYGETGYTSVGPLRVEDPDAIRIPADLSSVELTREHDADVVRGHLALVDDNGERCYIVVQLVDGALGDEALDEAESRQRAGLSWELVDCTVSPDGVLLAGTLNRIGQVAEPAFNSARVDQIAASHAAAVQPNERGAHMTPEQIARLAELRAADQLAENERAELAALEAMASAYGDEPADEQPADEQPAGDQPAEANAQPATVAASRRVPSVPTGVPARRGRQTSQAGAWERFCHDVVRAMQPGGGGQQAITAAFADVTSTANPGTEAPAWSGELWSGLQYEPEWTPLLASGDLTSWEGSGWRWTTKPSMQDYAGDKTAVPSNALVTEPSSYEAARMAVGHDIDRKFWDFPGGAAFLQSYGEAAREDWAVKLDAKVRAFVLANAVVYGAATTSVLKAAALAMFGVKQNTKARGTFIAVNDGDFLDLLDVSNDAVPAFLDVFNVQPGNFVVDSSVPAGTVVAGVKQAATVRTLPGSPIRVDAQHLANGGVDSAFFGYWAIEEHHTSGIVKTTFV